MPHLNRWLETMATRQACFKGVQVPAIDQDATEMQRWMKSSVPKMREQ